MARYVLVEFDDDTTANEFIKRIYKASKTKRFRILGVFKKPTEYCKCGPIASTQYTTALARGPKSGWFIHLECGLPRNMSQCPRNIWPDMLSAQKRKQTNSERIGTNISLALVDGKPRENFPIQEGYFDRTAKTT